MPSKKERARLKEQKKEAKLAEQTRLIEGSRQAELAEQARLAEESRQAALAAKRKEIEEIVAKHQAAKEAEKQTEKSDTAEAKQEEDLTYIPLTESYFFLNPPEFTLETGRSSAIPFMMVDAVAGIMGAAEVENGWHFVDYPSSHR